MRCQNLFRVRFGFGLPRFPKFLLILTVVQADSQMVSLRVDIRSSYDVCGRTGQRNLDLSLVDLLILLSLDGLVLNH